jgi:hypothetical protein
VAIIISYIIWLRHRRSLSTSHHHLIGCMANTYIPGIKACGHTLMPKSPTFFARGEWLVACCCCCCCCCWLLVVGATTTTACWLVDWWLLLAADACCSGATTTRRFFGNAFSFSPPVNASVGCLSRICYYRSCGCCYPPIII